MLDRNRVSEDSPRVQSSVADKAQPQLSINNNGLHSTDILNRCVGLTAYPNWNAASKAMKNVRFKPKRGQDNVKPVRCRFCHNWHLGRGDGR